MNCPRCQSPLLPDAKFCTSCGLALNGAASQETTSPGSQTPVDAATTSQTPYSAPADAAFGQSFAGQPAAAGETPPAPSAPSAPTFTPAQSQPFAPAQSQPFTPAPTPPAYSVPPSQPFQQAQPGYTTPPSQPYYPGQQPAYVAPPSQPMYPQQMPGVIETPYAPAQYATPASFPMTPSQYATPGSMPMGGPQYAAYAAPRQPSGPFMPHIFGVNADPNTAQPGTRLQAYLLKNVSRQYVVTKWFGATVGGLVAVVVGLLLSIPAQELWKKTTNLSSLFLPGAALSGGSGGGDPTTNALLSPGVFTFLPVENHVPLSYGLSGATTSITLPLLGLFIVPVLALILGGYVSAASDFSRRARFSVARGALIAPAYGVCLAIVALIGKHNSIGAQPLLAFLYGLLWGAVFGAIGGWIQQSGGAWLSSLIGKLQTLGNGRIVGAVAGAVTALVSVVLLGTACAMGYFAFFLSQSAGEVRAPDIGEVLRLGVTTGPTSGLYLLGMANGASVDTYTHGLGTSAGDSSRIGLLVSHHHPPNVWQFIIYGLALAGSYILGGRVAARVARAARTDQGFAAGAMMAVPLSLLMTLAAWLTLTTASSSEGSQSVTFGTGLSLGGVFVTSLVAGAVLGGIGGASVFSLPALGSLPRVLLLPFRPIGLALNPLLDALTGAPKGIRRSAPRAWIYDAALATVILGAAVIVLNIIGVTLAGSLPYPLLRAIFEFAGAALVGLPLMYLTGALFVALNSGTAAPAVAYAPPVSVPVMQPVAVGAWTQPPAQPMQMPMEGMGAYTPPPAQPGFPSAPTEQPQSFGDQPPAPTV